MARADSVGCQFRGTAQVVKAYHNMEITKWGLFCGKEILEAYDQDDDFNAAEDLLRNYLTELTSGGSKAYYVLRVYEDLPKGAKIRPNTEPTRSFRFALFQEGEGGYNSSNYSQIIDRLDSIEAKMTGEGPADEEKKMSGIAGFLNGMLDEPQVKQAIGQIFSELLNKIISPFMQTSNNQAQIPASAAAMGSVSEDVQTQKIQLAIADLWSVDKNLGDHLEKIASIAKSNPSKYNNLIGMLNLF